MKLLSLSALVGMLSVLTYRSASADVIVQQSLKYVSDCVATKSLVPVCGSDGESYANLSFLNCANKLDPSITLIHNGRCSSPKPVEPVKDYKTVPDFVYRFREPINDDSDEDDDYHQRAINFIY